MMHTDNQNAVSPQQPSLSDADRWPLFLLSSILLSYPDETFAADLVTLCDDEERMARMASVFGPAWTMLEERLQILKTAPAEVDELRSDYIDCFERGQGATPLYESEYQRERAMQKANVLCDLAGFYNAFGLKVGEEGGDMHDHVAIQLEFYAFLLMRQVAATTDAHEEGGEIVLDARRKFLAEHLAPLALAISTRPGLAGHNYYAPLFHWLGALVIAECEQLGITAQALSWVPGTLEPETASCATGCAVT
jgi:putative dimethyl sulfoxide reductase chaperone